MRLIDRLRHANMALMFTGESLRKSGQVFLPQKSPNAQKERNWYDMI